MKVSTKLHLSENRPVAQKTNPARKAKWIETCIRVRLSVKATGLFVKHRSCFTYRITIREDIAKRHILEVRGKSFIKPSVGPPVTGYQVTKPLKKKKKKKPLLHAEIFTSLLCNGKYAHIHTTTTINKVLSPFLDDFFSSIS